MQFRSFAIVLCHAVKLLPPRTHPALSQALTKLQRREQIPDEAAAPNMYQCIPHSRAFPPHQQQICSSKQWSSRRKIILLVGSKGGCWYRQQCLHLADPHMQPWLFQREASMPQGCPQQCFTCPLLLHWNQSLAAPQFKRRNIGLRCWSRRSWFSLLWWLRWHSKLSSEDTGD